MADLDHNFSFEFTPMPKVVFGAGKFDLLPENILNYGKSILIVTGSASFKKTRAFEALCEKLRDLGCKTHFAEIRGEPSVTAIDRIVAEMKGLDQPLDVIVGIGGGSALDMGKAISAMMMEEGSVRDYLEGMETRKPSGRKIPYIAVPTTSGTGAEATKNAVISEVGEKGFKRSLRHDNYIPEMALVDPILTMTLSREMTASCGLDALTQLIEAFVSIGASPMTDALCRSGLTHFKRGFETVLREGSTHLEARTDMAYASMLSGIVLANAGLGVVHGFASPLGGYYEAPHGVICATLLPDCTEMIIKQLWSELDRPVARKALEKYAEIGRLLDEEPDADIKTACDGLIAWLRELNIKADIPKLYRYGLIESDLDKVIDGVGNKNGPTKIGTKDLRQILEKQLRDE